MPLLPLTHCGRTHYCIRVDPQDYSILTAGKYRLHKVGKTSYPSIVTRNYLRLRVGQLVQALMINLEDEVANLLINTTDENMRSLASQLAQTFYANEDPFDCRRQNIVFTGNVDWLSLKSQQMQDEENQDTSTTTTTNDEEPS